MAKACGKFSGGCPPTMGPRLLMLMAATSKLPVTVIFGTPFCIGKHLICLGNALEHSLSAILLFWVLVRVPVRNARE